MMDRRILGCAAALLIGHVGIAAAAPATPEEAHRLTGLFERYIGHVDGPTKTVTVVPHGEAYTATFDIGWMLHFLGAFGVDVTTGELAVELQPQNDGLWHVTVDGLPPIGVNAPNGATSITYNGYTFDGIFDPKIQAFGTATTTTGGSTSHSVGKEGVSDAKLSDSGTSTIKSMATAPGHISADTRSSLKDIDYHMSLAPASPAGSGGTAPPATAFAAHVGGFETTMTVADQPVVAIEDLWQFLVAHPTKEALVANQDELKTRLKAILPLASATHGDLSMSTLNVDTPLGPFRVGHIGETYAYAGAAAPDGLALTLSMADLGLPDGLAPPWAASLVPLDFDLSLSEGPLKVTPILTTLIDNLDLTADPPIRDDQTSAILTGLAAQDLTVRVAKSTVHTSLLTVTVEGEARTAKPMPYGSATITATGLDKVIAALRMTGRGVPSAQQLVMAIMQAKGVAKAEGPDSYSWHIEAPQGGEVTINGTSLSAMNGTPPPRLKPQRAPKMAP